MIAASLKPHFRTISELRKNAELQAYKIIEDNKERIIDFTRKDQLFKRGVDSNNKKMVPSYAESTKKRKRKKGLPTNRVTHFHTGKHYNNFDIKTGNLRYQIFSTTKVKGFDLASHLNDSYGGQVYDNTEENNLKVNEKIIAPKLIEWVLQDLRKKLNL